MTSLFDHQKRALNQLKTGSILCGGVGSGKSLVAIAYYYEKEKPKALYIITTAAKRDTGDWENEYSNFMLAKEEGIQPIVDSWNNIKKYVEVKNSFFIFDEQRVVGSGAWVKSFLQITKQNNWILLSATPGDTWMDYVPVFIANGFYKNRTEFIRRHVIYNTFIKFPKVDHYVEENKLIKLRNYILVDMPFKKLAKKVSSIIFVSYDVDKLELVLKRWNPYEDKPIKNVSEYCYTLRKVVNSDMSRFFNVRRLLNEHGRIIVFYNFDYELDILRMFQMNPKIEYAEHNGHKHQPVPKAVKWIYVVQYTSGAEGWNCVDTNAVVFYSLNYSYRVMTQAAGRIDRLNTPFAKLYYYYLQSHSPIDVAISKALSNKKSFNETDFLGSREKLML